MELGGEEGSEEQNNNERKLIRRPPPSDTDKWIRLPQVPKKAEMGYLHLSFEYHKGALRVRVWQISDLLLPPPQISNIHSLFVRGYFMPDKAGKTLRRTEEVILEQPDAPHPRHAKTSIQHIFTASSFRFRTPLLYTGVSEEIVKQRSLQLEVCMVQRGTGRVFLAAMVHMPLRTAVRRPIREKYPLIPCTNPTIPNNMRVYSALDLQLDGGLDPPGARLRKKKKVSVDDVEELEDVSLSGEEFIRSHLALCLDDSEEEGVEAGLRADFDGRSIQGGDNDGWLRGGEVNGFASGASSTTTINTASSGEEADASGRSTPVCNGGDTASQSGRSTPVEGRMTDSASKKRIIPNEVIAGDGSDDEAMPTEDSVGEMDTSSVVSGRLTSVAHDAGPVRKKIIPTVVVSPNTSSETGDLSVTNFSDADEMDVSKTEAPSLNLEPSVQPSSLDRSLQPSSPDRSSQRKKVAVLQNEIDVPPSDSNLAPPRLSGSSDSSSATANPTIDALSPLADSAFTPASRPETPCWDFYDFAEDLQPEEDSELSGRSLEESIAQLREYGIGSLQNLSKEPILPMVLTDDLDSLAAEAEEVHISEH